MIKILHNLNLTISSCDSPQQKYQKLLQVVRRRVRKYKPIHKIEEGLCKVEIKFLYPVSSYHSYIFSLLRTCSHNSDLGTGEIQKLSPIEIEVKRGSQIEVGYSLHMASFPKKYHNKSWRLSGGDYLKIYDFSTLIAEIHIENALFDSIQNQDVILNNILYRRYNDEDKWTIISELLEKSANLKIANKSKQTKYARAFQTKKSIRKKTQEVMESNAFLEYYGYVELDNDVDLQKFSSLEEHFLDFAKKFPIPVAKDHSFRIKKLGRYNADGMYFPQQKTLIFAIDHPECYSHELAHQIDYSLGSEKPLSKQAPFAKITKLYKETVSKKIETLPNHSHLKKRWFSRQKFNSNYYCQSMEVFARSFELYLCHVNIRNPLIDRNFFGNHLYPQEKEYLEEVASYMDKYVLSVLR